MTLTRAARVALRDLANGREWVYHGPPDEQLVWLDGEPGPTLEDVEVRAAEMEAEPPRPRESDTTADEDLRTAIAAATNLNELKAALLGTSPNARAQVAGRPT